MAFDVDALVPVPHAPPRTWFEDVPDWFDPNGALVQVDTESGRVAAIVAPYGECILDGTQNCWTPPQSHTAYEYAHVGTMICDDGSKVRIANVGGGVPHANLTASSSVAADHYANTASRKMIGRYVDSPDKGGILFLGSMWPGTSNRDVIDVVASALSGDWRWIQSLNDYEMVGSQLVNNPGFRPIPGKMPVRASAAFVALRTAMVAGVSEDGPAPVRGVWEPAGVVEVLADKLARVAAVTADLVEDWGDDDVLPDAHTAAAPKMKKNVPGVRETWKPKGKSKTYTGKDRPGMVDWGTPKAQKNALPTATPSGRVRKMKGDGDGDGVPYEAAKRKASAAERRAKKALKGAKRGAVEPEAVTAASKAGKIAGKARGINLPGRGGKGGKGKMKGARVNGKWVWDRNRNGRVFEGTPDERPAEDAPSGMTPPKATGGKAPTPIEKKSAPSKAERKATDVLDRSKGKAGPVGGDKSVKDAKMKIESIKAKGKEREDSRKGGRMVTRSLAEQRMEYEGYRDAVNASQPEPRSNDELADVSPIDMSDAEIQQIGLDEAMKRLNDRGGRKGKEAGIVRDTDEANRESSLYSELAAKKRAEGGDKPAGDDTMLKSSPMAEKPAGGSTLTPEQKGEMRGEGEAENLTTAALREQLSDEQLELLGDRDLSGIVSGSGTKDDPFLVSDLELAAELLILGGMKESAGKDVLQIKLERPDEVVTLVDRLQAVAQDARAKKEKAPNYNLCKLTVPGTNLFCTESIGRLREKMPQLKTKDPIPGSEADKMPRNKDGEVDLVDMAMAKMEADGLTVEEDVDLPASRFRASQIELNGGKVAGIMNGLEMFDRIRQDGAVSDDDLANGSVKDLGGGRYKFDDQEFDSMDDLAAYRKEWAQKGYDDLRGGIIVTSDGYIVDGHHRWAAIVGLGLEGTDIDMKVKMIDGGIVEVLDSLVKWANEKGSPNAVASLGARRPCRSC